MPRPTVHVDARYFASEKVQVAVAVRLTLSGPTQAGGKVIASPPEMDEAVAASVPVPEKEHPGGNPPLWAGTVKVAAVSCAPATVPVSVALALPPPPSMTIGPEALAPLWAAVHDRTGIDFSGLVIVPVHVPARLSAGAGAGEGEGDVGDALLLPEPQPAIETTQTLTSEARIQLDRIEPPLVWL